MNNQNHTKITVGLVAAGDLQTAQAGAAILKQGGNAIDAAVAAAFASFVAEMVLVSIGGSGIGLVHLAAGDTIAYDFFSDIPSGRFDSEQSDFKRILVDFGSAQQPFYIGRASVAVPGVVAGLCAMAQDHGTLPLKILLEPAINLARHGVVLSESLGYIATLLADIFRDTPPSAAVYAPKGPIAQVGDRLHNPKLAATLEMLGELGPDYFYRGELAGQIVQDQLAHGGLLMAQDLAGYYPNRSEAIDVDYRGYSILLPPLSSIGGVLIAFSLKLLSRFDLAGFSHHTASHLQILAEVMRLTNIARQDLAAGDVSADQFLSDAHVTRYHNQLHHALNNGLQLAEPHLSKGPSDTTHISVVDAAGNMVSLTTSAGEGAGFMVGDTGVSLNNMLGEHDLHPYGFHQSSPGTRMQTMMSPVIVLKNSHPVMALGSGGSTRLRSAILQVLSNVIDFDMPLVEAVQALRIHFEDGVLQLEGEISSQVASELTRLGYQVNSWPDKSMYFGGVHAVGLVGGRSTPVGDTRRGGVGLVVRH